MRYTPWALLLAATDNFHSSGLCEKSGSQSLTSGSVYDVWLASRVIPSGNGGTTTLVAGAQRPINAANTHLALQILKRCTPELVCESGTSSNFFSHLHSRFNACSSATQRGLDACWPSTCFEVCFQRSVAIPKYVVGHGFPS